MKAITKWHIILHSTGIVLEIRSSAEIGICYGRLFLLIRTWQDYMFPQYNTHCNLLF